MHWILRVTGFLVLNLTATEAFAQNLSSQSTIPIHLQLTGADLPYNLQWGYLRPTMREALDVTASLDELLFYSQENFVRNHNLFGSDSLNRSLVLLGVSLEYCLWIYFPFSDVWLHESFHQAVLQANGISSFDEIYRFPFFSSVVPVDHVSETDLARLKQESNPNFVRLSAAGIEGQTQLVDRLEANRFFSGGSFSAGLGVVTAMNFLNNSAYIFLSASPIGEGITDALNQAEATNQEARDFTGLDFTAWVYDLFHPDVPYAARGPHPYGVGIDRYIKPSDLTSEEWNYLVLQGALSLLSFVDLGLFLQKDLALPGNSGWFNASLRYYMTSFGNSIVLNTYLRRDFLKARISLLNQTNAVMFFPGLDLELVDYPLEFEGVRFLIGTRLCLWAQPEKQQFRSSVWEWGGLGSLRFEWRPVEALGLWVEGEGKTPGWVAGNEFLQGQFVFRAGVRYDL